MAAISDFYRYCDIMADTFLGPIKMPLAGKGLTLGGGEGVKYVPWVCSNCRGGGLTRGNDKSLFIHCMNRQSGISPPDRTGSCVFTHKGPDSQRNQLCIDSPKIRQV